MARKARSDFWLNARRLRRDDRGAVLLLVAVTMTAVLAITGLAVDVGWWYTIQRQNQSAADSAALSAAYEVIGHPTWTTQAQLGPAALKAAQLNGYTGPTATVNKPCGSPPCLAANSTGVEVKLQQAQSTWFAALAGLTGVTIANRAVAKVTPLDDACMYVLNPTASPALSITGSAALLSPTCSICVDSTASDAIYMQGGGNTVMTADSLLSAGGLSTKGSTTPTLTHGAQLGAPQPQCADPYAAALNHTFLTTGMPTTPACSVTGNGTANVTVSSVSGCTIAGAVNGNNPPINPTNGGTVNVAANTQFTGGFHIKDETVNLAPGTYWITDGDLTLDSNAVLKCTMCTPGGAGVTIILTKTGAGGAKVGNVQEAANASISLNAPGGTGTYQDLLFVQDSIGPFTPGGSTFQGGPTQTLFGLVYFPKSSLTFQGNPTTTNNSCLITVADTLTLAGNPTLTTGSGFSTTGCPTTGPGGKKQILTVALVE